MVDSTRNPAEPRLLSVKQTAQSLACSVANVYALIEAGELAVVNVGKSKGYRIDRRDLEAFIQQRKFRFETPRPKLPTVRLKHIRR